MIVPKTHDILGRTGAHRVAACFARLVLPPTGLLSPRMRCKKGAPVLEGTASSTASTSLVCHPAGEPILELIRCER